MTSPSDSTQLFDEFYYAHNCGLPYERSEDWLAFFRKIAERAAADFNPQSVLDAGCAKGFLVEGFRQIGVNAWGIDISAYAIGEVHPNAQAFCSVGSIADPLPQKYDLIINIEVVEHMPPEEANRAIENLCCYSDNILISTSPFDFKEITHINVHPPDFWVRAFARHNFYRDLDYDASYITPWAMRFQRIPGSIQPVVQSYERHFWQMKTELQDLRASLLEYHNRLRETEQQLAEIQKTRSWQLVHKLQALHARIAPPGSLRAKLLRRMLGRNDPSS